MFRCRDCCEVTLGEQNLFDQKPIALNMTASKSVTKLTSWRNIPISLIDLRGVYCLKAAGQKLSVPYTLSMSFAPRQFVCLIEGVREV